MPISRGACRNFLEDFSGFVDGTLDPRRRALLIAHLDCCEACLRHLRAYRKGVAAFRDAEPGELAWGLYERVVERLGDEPADRATTTLVPAPERGARPAMGAVGAALVMAALALFVVVPQAGRIGPSQRGPDPGTAATLAGAPTSWASVIPSALPLPGIGRDAADGLRSSAASVRSGRVRPEVRLAIDELPEVPRREVRMVRFDGLGRPIPSTILTGWSPRRPPVVIDRGATVFPAAWVAEAALRIP
ncbi:MAG TPA: zf-HC2 domain-containing protein [Gemmatimonadota bacterium]|jgi:hypothetical protein|nr:zf-HC2 domain-containing protein [Gemmatimonadota bacterium]